MWDFWLHTFRIDIIKLNWLELIEITRAITFAKINLPNIIYVQCMQCVVCSFPTPEISNNLQLLPIIRVNWFSPTFKLLFRFYLLHSIWFNFPLYHDSKLSIRFIQGLYRYKLMYEKCHVSMCFQLNAKTLMKSLKMISIQPILFSFEQFSENEQFFLIE